MITQTWYWNETFSIPRLNKRLKTDHTDSILKWNFFDSKIKQAAKKLSHRLDIEMKLFRFQD